MRGTTDPEIVRTDTALGRCFVDGDAATKLRDRRRRREALGISFSIEAAVLALLIAAPLMTSVAQPHFNTTSFVPIAFSASHTHSSTQHPPSTIHPSKKFHDHPFTFTINPTPQRPAPRAEEGEEGADPPISGAGPLGGSPPPGGNLIARFEPTDVPVQPAKEIKK